MTRRITALLVILVLAGLVVSPADAAKKKKKKKVKKPVAVTSTQYLAWVGDCTGSAMLSPTVAPNPDACALFFPELGSTFTFAGTAPAGLKLNAAKPITVDFSLSQVATAAADFRVDVTATVAGKEMTLATGTETITAEAQSSHPFHYELKPDAAANGKVLTSLAVTVTWASGFTYSSMEIEPGDDPVVIHGFK